MILEHKVCTLLQGLYSGPHSRNSPALINCVGTRCRVEMTTQQSNNNQIYFLCSVVQWVVLVVISHSEFFFCCWYRASNITYWIFQPASQTALAERLSDTLTEVFPWFSLSCKANESSSPCGLFYTVFIVVVLSCNWSK